MDEMKKYISSKYKPIAIAGMVDEAILNYIDSDWEEEGYEDEYEWYSEYGRGEAEQDVIDFLIDDAEKKTKSDLNMDDKIKFGKWLASKFNSLMKAK